MHDEQMTASEEVKGVAHMEHEGPLYCFMEDQQCLQKGAYVRLSEAFPHEGQ
ncbi:MAG: hypothetical protein HZA17_05055 [Nitrospirae bacterium]|nr:hypothetical protein [Nitrospirota bacterium]